MNPTHFGDPLTLPVAPPAGQSFDLSCERLQHLPGGSAQNLDIYVQVFFFLQTLELLFSCFVKCMLLNANGLK